MVKPRRIFATVTALALLAVAGLANLPLPFSGDQALFSLGARALSRGAVLYRDFWDLKQPGIYWFYRLAGATFGYNEIAVHTLELIWFLALALLIVVSMRPRFALACMGELCALFTVGVYLTVCRTWHLTQLEGLVALPLFAGLILAVPTTPGATAGKARWFGFGIAAGVVAVFKLLLLAIPIAIFAVTVLPFRTQSSPAAIRRAMIAAVFAVFGMSIVLGPLFIFYAMQHQLPLIWQTFFVIPARIAHEVPRSKPIVLIAACKWFALASAPLLPLALVGVLRCVRRPSRFLLALLVWIVVAAAIVLVQHMWWEYHFLLVLFPVGILASFGFQDVLICLRDTKILPRQREALAITVLLSLLVSPYAFRFARKAWVDLRARNQQALRQRISPDYAASLTEARWIESQSAADVYVLGNPLILCLCDHPQPIPLNGWSPEWFLPDQWQQLHDQLLAHKPGYLFIATENDHLIDERGASLRQLIAEHYKLVRQSENGRWYRWE
jgi:hypothetical protein